VGRFDETAKRFGRAIGAFGGEIVGRAVACADVAGIFDIRKQGNGVEAQAADVIELGGELIEAGDAIGPDADAIVVAGEGADVDLVDDQVGWVWRGEGIAVEPSARHFGRDINDDAVAVGVGVGNVIGAGIGAPLLAAGVVSAVGAVFDHVLVFVAGLGPRDIDGPVAVAFTDESDLILGPVVEGAGEGDFSGIGSPDAKGAGAVVHVSANGEGHEKRPWLGGGVDI
jgi:hypothetical protein